MKYIKAAESVRIIIFLLRRQLIWQASLSLASRFGNWHHLTLPTGAGWAFICAQNFYQTNLLVYCLRLRKRPVTGTLWMFKKKRKLISKAFLSAALVWGCFFLCALLSLRHFWARLGAGRRVAAVRSRRAAVFNTSTLPEQRDPERDSREYSNSEGSVAGFLGGWWFD